MDHQYILDLDTGDTYESVDTYMCPEDLQQEKNAIIALLTMAGSSINQFDIDLMIRNLKFKNVSKSVSAHLLSTRKAVYNRK